MTAMTAAFKNPCVKIVHFWKSSCKIFIFPHMANKKFCAHNSDEKKKKLRKGKKIIKQQKNNYRIYIKT